MTVEALLPGVGRLSPPSSLLPPTVALPDEDVLLVEDEVVAREFARFFGIVHS